MLKPTLSPSLLDTLHLWQQLGILRPLDTALVQMLQQRVTAAATSAVPVDADQGTQLWLWLALCSAQLAQGHLCLDLQRALQQPSTLVPAGSYSNRVAAQLSQFVAGQSLDSVLNLLQQATLLVGETSTAMTPLMLRQQRLYLRRYWQYEQQISAFISQSNVATLQLRQQLPAATVRPLLQQLFAGNAHGSVSAVSAPDWQQLACALAVSSRFAVITGGPGTGKTTTVVKLLLLLQLIQQQHDAPPLSIKLAAPTGKAAARLCGSVSGALGRLQQELQLHERLTAHIPTTAQTLHRLLGSGPDRALFRYHADFPLPLDVLVVDEASMVDVAMFAAMVAALPAKATLIVLGDKDQLASVEAGAVMAELCRDASSGGYSAETAHWLAALSGQQIPLELQSMTPSALEQQVVMLRTSHRFTAQSGIGQLAQAVNQGDAATAVALLQRQNAADLAWWPLQPDEAAFAALVVHGQPDGAAQQGFAGYLQLVRQPPAPDATAAVYDQWAIAVLSQFGQFQLLCAVRQGKFGVEQLNLRISQILQKQQWIDRIDGWYPGRPVMVVQNDYATGLMNGDVGLCLPRSEWLDGQWQIRLRVAFAGVSADEPVRWILPSRLPAVETVYAMTVHKSQGSEFAHAVLVLPEQSSALLTRELIYTGITRAASRFSLICADKNVLSQAILQRTERSGGLRL